MKNKLFRFSILLLTVIFTGCSKDKAEWVFDRQIELPKNSRPLAMVKIADRLWVSDPEYYRILEIDQQGNILDSIVNLKRPMNIDAYKERLYVPEYLTDTIWAFESGKKQFVLINTQLQAPAGITVHEDTIAIADFYNHRIVLQIGSEITSIGKEGHETGELYYPTDVKIFGDKIYAADAYNNRVQVFESNGEFVKVIGADDQLNVTSGIDITKDIIAVTDQENDRVLMYDHNGTLLQSLTENIDYPTDVLLNGDTLYITNFQGSSISIFEKRQ